MRQGTSGPAEDSAIHARDEPNQPVCQQFEAAWQSASGGPARPSLAEYLSTVPEPQWSTLFSTLLAVEVRCRQQQGEQPLPEEYLAQFPQAGELIRGVFQQLGTGSRRPTSSLSGQEGIHKKSSLADPTVDYFLEDEPGPELAKRATAEGASDITRARASTPSAAPTGDEGPAGVLPSALPDVPGYEVLGVLGKGGMGIVYKARHLQLRRVVALKMILPDHQLSRGRLERFLNEARAVARFQHPHLVQIHEIGSHAGHPYFSLELLGGGSLHSKVRGAPQPAREAAALVEILAGALDYAHGKGIVHRDLKPANILLTTEGIPKVTDFGLAFEMDQDSGQTVDGGIVGTPNYMAPEQASGSRDQISPRSDIYALGVILYEMLTGRPPFQAAAKLQTLQMVRTQEPVPPRRLVAQVPRDLELICLKCLQKDPAQRFQRASELAEELRRFLEGRPIRTRPAPWWERAWKWSRRQPAAASLIAVSLFALLSVMLYLDQRARGAQRELREQQRTTELRDKVQTLHRLAQEAADEKRLPQAQSHLHAAFEIIQVEPSLTSLRPPLQTLSAEVARREEELQGAREADNLYAKFFEHRDDALFHGMVFSGVDLPASVDKTKKASQAAVALFGITLESTAAPQFPRHFSEERTLRCKQACYEMLMVWAEAEAQPEAGRARAMRPQLERALRVLDRAGMFDAPASHTYHVRRARYLELLGEGQAAQRQQLLATRLPAQTALDHFLTGDSHQKQGKFAEAALEFAYALNKQPDHFWARYFLAICNLQLQRPAEARDNLTACLISRPDFLWLYLFRAFAQGQLNDFAAAEEDYRRALASNPDTQALYGIWVNQGVLCMRQARRVEGFLPVPLPYPLLSNLELPCLGAAQAYRHERLSLGANLLKRAIALQPGQPTAYRYLALLLQQQERRQEALELVKQGIAAAKDREPALLAQLYRQRAQLHRERQELDDALDSLERALKTFPVAEDHAQRGRILFALNKPQDALMAYNKALQLQGGEDANLYRWQAEVLVALQRDQEAVHALTQYLAKGGRPGVDIFRSRGFLHAKLRQVPAALADYTQAVTLQPDAANYTARAWVFLANDILPLALQDFERALKLDPRSAEAYAGRGLIRARLGQQSEALRDVELALLHRGTRQVRLLWNIAHVYAQLADSTAIEVATLPGRRARYENQAVEVLQKCVEEVPVPERAAFWKQYVSPDALLHPLRGHGGFQALERQYGRANNK